MPTPREQLDAMDAEEIEQIQGWIAEDPSRFEVVQTVFHLGLRWGVTWAATAATEVPVPRSPWVAGGGGDAALAQDLDRTAQF